MTLPTPPSSFTVLLQPRGQRFEAPAGTTLLAAALAAGLPLARSCRNGACRACMCRVVAGEVRWRVEWPGLNPDEKRAGYVLPCVSEAASDLVLEETPYGR